MKTLFFLLVFTGAAGAVGSEAMFFGNETILTINADMIGNTADRPCSVTIADHKFKIVGCELNGASAR